MEFVMEEGFPFGRFFLFMSCFIGFALGLMCLAEFAESRMGESWVYLLSILMLPCCALLYWGVVWSIYGRQQANEAIRFAYRSLSCRNSRELCEEERREREQEDHG